MQRTRRTPIALLAIATWLAGCGSDGEKSTAAGEDPEEHACEHIGVPGTAITAADTTASAPAIAIAEEPYTVSITPQVAGYLKIQGPVVGLLFVGTADVVTLLTYEGDTADLLPQGAPNEHCASDIPEHFDLDLDQTGTYYLKLGPSALDQVWLMLTEATGHAH